MRFAATLAFTLVSISALPSTARAADPFIGTWKLDKAKSQVGSTTYQERTAIISGSEKAHHVVTKNKLRDGTASNAERDEVFDGKEHPFGTDGTVEIAKRVNSNTLTYNATKDGKPVRTETDTVSDDGKTLTRTINDLARKEKRIWVYERQ